MRSKPRPLEPSPRPVILRTPIQTTTRPSRQRVRWKFPHALAGNFFLVEEVRVMVFTVQAVAEQHGLRRNALGIVGVAFHDPGHGRAL